MANDKISAMTAAGAGDLVGTTTRIEVSSLYTTVPATLGCALALLRTTMFAGGSGYTATDPITAGAASFTTLAASSTAAITGNLTVGASTFVVTAATGAVAVASTTTNAFGGAGAAGTLLKLTGTIAAAGSANGQGLFMNPVIQNPSGSDSFVAIIGGTLQTFTSGTHADFASVQISACGLTANGATVTNATTLKIVGAPSGGSNNRALWVTAGDTLLGGPLAITGALTGVTSIAISGAATTQAAGVLSLGNTTQATVGAAGGASALPATPTGYIKTYIGSTQFVIPYYAQA